MAEAGEEGTRSIFKNTADLILRIDLKEVLHSDKAISSSEPCYFLCSYNWRRCLEPSIYVPGAPRKWSPHPLPITLTRDCPTSPEEQQYHPIPTYHFEPVFRALTAVNSDFRFDDVDLVTNRNNLRKLLQWVEGAARRDFRIDLDIVNDTLFMTRWEANNSVLRSGSHNPAYGSNFEKFSSNYQEDLVDSTDHHRVIHYTLGALKCVVRSEVDAYYVKVGEPQSLTGLVADAPRSASTKNYPVTSTDNYKPTEVLHRGCGIPTAATLEIKSCQERCRLDGFMPQLWFSRTPRIMIGYHREGTFTRVQEWDAGSRFLAWELQHQENLRKLVGLIAELKRIVRATKAPCAIIYQKNRRSKKIQPALRVYRRVETMPVLPGALIEQHWNRGLPSSA
ncbi:uncharacterized protein N7511_008463 [Penicillium nucicola]|uniref:uncharacterized protein n=1 Tax=Penicillium nucicola TaxID=1850975 RepID=UPI00254539E7|nr:uncharacterized protein N7511_008463 [Penicillium nucicola]KAJ5751498.1 hypothetical protein N7511_008463 [Penicillium nucicola]